MKSERRHELKTNELADWLAGVIQKIKPYRNAILAVVILVAVTTAAYSWWARKSADKQTAAWNGFYTAMNEANLRPEDFEQIAQEFPDTQAAAWARVVAGDLHRTSGCDALFFNKPTARDELRQAISQYEIVLQQGRHPMLCRRATFGWAMALEAQGELKEAEELYREVSENPDGTYAVMAARRLEDLQRTSTRRWYDEKFASFDPAQLGSGPPGGPDKPLDFDWKSLSDGPTLGADLLKPEKPGATDEKPIPLLRPSTDPDAPEPDATTPDAATPDATEPDATTPDATEPDAAEPDATAPDATAPDTTAPDAAAEQATKPDAAEPDAAEPDAAEPDAAEPDASEPDADQPKADAPAE